MNGLEKYNRGSFRLFPQSTLGRVILALVLFAFFVDIYTVLKGLHQPVLMDNAISPKNYKSFFQVPAWFPFPVYFILVYLVVKQSWDAFNDAWRTLLDTNVVQGNVDKDALKKNKVMDDVTSAFNRWRNRWLIPLSIILGFTTMYFDSEREQDIMMNSI